MKHSFEKKLNIVQEREAHERMNGQKLSHKGRYGYRRITAEMRNLGYKINHKTVQKLMGILGLKIPSSI
jgi:hypothetical protein